MDTVTAPSYETYDDAGNPNASWFTRGTADQFATAGMSDMTATWSHQMGVLSGVPRRSFACFWQSQD